MINKLKYYLALLFTITLGYLAGDQIQYDQQIIEKISIEMVNLAKDSLCDSSTILPRIKTKEGNFFSQTDFDNDLKNLVQEFDRVEPILNSVDNKLFITLKIWPKSMIRSINWSGNCKISTEKLKKELGISTCSVFDRQSFNKAFHKLKTFYVKEGFFEASLYYTIELDAETNSVDIQICIDEGRAGRIQRIKFVNFTCNEENDICDEMVTKKYCILTSWYTEEGTYQDQAMHQDKMMILSHLQNEGYADAKVDVEVCEAKSKNRLVITITADRGERYYFGPASFSGNTLFTDEEIENLYLFSEGDPYSPEDIRETIQQIVEAYGRRGYIDAVVDYEPILDCENRIYAVNFTIEEGEQFSVGLIKVFGNCTTKTSVILHETLLIPGEIFNLSKLKWTEERLTNIGYFKHVNVYAVRTESSGRLGEHYRDVNIEVEETTTGNFGAGFGMSTAENIFGEFRITERNFNYEGLTRFWNDGFHALRGGGEYLGFNVMIGAKSRKYSMAWTKPYFRDTPWVVGFEIQRSNNRYISDEYDINSTSFITQASYPLNVFLRLGVHYRITNAYITLNRGEIRHNEKKILKKDTKKTKETLRAERKHSLSEMHRNNEKLRDEARNMGLISAIGINLNYDSTDNPVYPHRGIKSSIEQELAGFGGDHTFMSLAYLNSFYYPVGERGVIKLKGDVRFIVPLFDTKSSHIPIDERLFLGGENAIRGYHYYRLGPQYTQGDPRGGMSMQILSAQYSYVLGKRANVFVFCDSGHLDFDIWGFGKMWTALGFGVNLQVLENAPPVTVGFGFPINADHHHHIKRFFFNLGGSF